MTEFDLRGLIREVAAQSTVADPPSIAELHDGHSCSDTHKGPAVVESSSNGDQP